MEIFHRLVVWLNRPAAEQGALALAMDWAGRLALPICAVIGRDQVPGQPHVDFETVLARGCGYRGISWTVSAYEGPLTAAIGRLVEPADLVVLGSGFAANDRKRLLRFGHGDLPAVLVTPDQWHPWSRALVLDEDHGSQESFLPIAVELCRRLQVQPVILTVARSTRRATLRQTAAKALLAESGLGCDFDVLVGAETRAAVANVARWRRCKGIVVERRAAPPWWRWWQSPTAERLMNLTDSFNLLALPGRGSLNVALALSHTPAAPREPFPLPC